MPSEDALFPRFIRPPREEERTTTDYTDPTDNLKSRAALLLIRAIGVIRGSNSPDLHFHGSGGAAGSDAVSGLV
jgi:hypothetical protein